LRRTSGTPTRNPRQNRHLIGVGGALEAVQAMAQTIREKARIRQNRDDGRPSEDDIARKDLGPRGETDKADTAKMTEDSEQQTPQPLDPGHTA
jgi:hypothetical protein